MVRDSITADFYVYFEEVTRDMPGFEIWPHNRPMDIEAPAQLSERQDFIYRYPFSVREPNSYVKNFRSSAKDADTVPQTNSVTIEYPVHLRY